MKAIVLEKAGDVKNFTIKEVEKPKIKPNEVLIQTKALSVNPVDVKTRADEDILKLVTGVNSPMVLGWDVSGVVVAIGNDVKDFKIGDNVFGMVNFPGVGNAYAEYVAALDHQIAKIPKNISFEEAATTTLAATTALQALSNRVKKGDRILIHAGSGGVGHFAIQIAKSLGAYVITTTSAANKDFVVSLGADEVIDYQTQKFQEIVSDLDFVLDMFNGEILLNSIEVIKNGGDILSLPTFEFSDEILNAAKEKGVNVYFTQVNANKITLNAKELSKMLESGTIKPHISKTFTFEQMGEAHSYIESGRTVGKIAVTV